MQFLLTEEQKASHENFKAFVRGNVEPFAEEWDREEKVPHSAISMLAKSGYLGCNLPSQYGGQGWDTVIFGLLNEALGRGSSSLTGMITVQSMVSRALLKWGSGEQIQKWIPSLAKGEIIGAFALTEPGGGSDIQSLKTEFTPSRDGFYFLNGVKKWITAAQIASVFLVFGKLGDCPVACLVSRDTPGLEIDSHSRSNGFPSGWLSYTRFQKR